jgi:folate-binding protein YgfZ
MKPPADHRCHPWRPAAWLRVSGEDAAGFLQGQFTNDIRLSGPGRAVYGLWLNHKGRVLADSFVLPGDKAGEFWVGSYFSGAETIRRRLEAFIVADDVTLDDQTDAWAGVALMGDGAGEWLASSRRAGFTFRGRRSAEAVWEWMFPAADAQAVRMELAGIPETTPQEMERLRIAAGIPAVPADIGPGDLPNEGRIEADALSGAKGCYMGQEVMARLKTRGKVRRSLFRVAGPGPWPTGQVSLWQEGRPAGELRSSAPDPDGAGMIGLAMLTLRDLRTDAPLSLSAGGAQAPGIVMQAIQV